MSDLAHLKIWDDPAIRNSLSWYLDVAENRRPAKFRIAATLATEIDPHASTEDALWAELDRLTPIFWRAGGRSGRAPHCRQRRTGRVSSSYAASSPTACSPTAISVPGIAASTGWRGQSSERANSPPVHGSARISITPARSCSIAARKARARSSSPPATCGAPSARTATSVPTRTMARRRIPRTLAAMAWTLRREGCHNINWVGGEVVIHLHAIVDAIALLGRDFMPTQAELARARKTKADRFFWFDEVPGDAVYDGKFNAPMLWNSNFFMTLESMKILRILTDVWLPDFKFGPGRCAMTLAKTPWYWETVTRNIALLDNWGEDYSIRHLVMPNHVECCTYPVLEWIAQHVPAAPVNVMAQFHPDNFCDPASVKYRDKYAEIARRPTHGELDCAWRRARELGLKFETTTFERCKTFDMPAMLEM